MYKINLPRKFKSPFEQRFWLLLSSVLFFHVLFFYIPWDAEIINTGLEASRNFILHASFAENLELNKNAVWAYGPLGFLSGNFYHPETYGWLLALRTIISFGFLALAFWLIYQAALPIFAAAFLLVALIFAQGIYPSLDVFALSICALFLFQYLLGKGGKYVTLPLAIIISILGLVKIVFLFAGLAVVGISALHEVFTKKKPPLHLALYVLSFLIFWDLSYYGWSRFPSYILGGLELSRGFPAISIQGPALEIASFLLGFTALLGAYVLMALKYKSLNNSLLAIGLFILGFLGFNGGFIRHDEHAIIPAALLVTLAIFTILFLYKEKCDRRFLAAIAGAFVLGIFIISHAVLGVLHNPEKKSVAGYMAPRIGTGYADALFRKAGHMLDFFINDGENLKSKHEQALRNIRQQFPLPEVVGNVDIYSNALAVLAAYDFNYAPRPVMMSYAAYTKKLAALNDNYLKSKNAPGHIFFAVDPTDNNFPTLEDGRSWLTIMKNYDPKGFYGDFIHLKKSFMPRNYDLVEVITYAARLGQYVNVPDSSGPLWAEIRIKKALLGKLKGAIFKNPPLFMDVILENGSHKSFRLKDILAEDGFLLSPLVENAAQFAMLMAEDSSSLLKGAKVKRIQIRSGGDVMGPLSRHYRENVAISFFYLNTEAQDLSHLSDWKNLQIMNNFEPIYAEIPPRMLDSETLLAHAPSRLFLPMDKLGKKLKIGFGIADEAWNREDDPTDGVEFRILLVEEDGDEEQVWSRYLDPKKNKIDRGTHTIMLEIKDTDIKGVMFETIPGEEFTWDWSYWSNIQVVQ